MTEQRRVVVSSPRTHRARSAGERSWSLAHDLDEQTELGAVYVRTLIRAQLRTALATLTVVAVVLAGLPLLLALLPSLSRSRLYGIPVPWLGLALCVQPIWIGAAARHLRQAERIERDFARLVDRS
ncbi:hypothetical protein ACGFNU_12455 [Spirillospora sp. NPDC048911]|uniref:hypothetical protein n=1 Tax=Spirillospora sp. NPDC048911 TaxID=3364527 RepID=UPI00371A65FF